jgi:hypothetical protein
MKAAFPLLVLAVSAAAQQPPNRTFGKAEVEFAEPFSQLVGLRELRDGRLIVSDSKDKVLQIIDLKTGRGTAIGREGAGPNEWMSLTRLLPFPATRQSCRTDGTAGC